MKGCKVNVMLEVFVAPVPGSQTGRAASNKCHVKYHRDVTVLSCLPIVHIVHIIYDIYFFCNKVGVEKSYGWDRSTVLVSFISIYMPAVVFFPISTCLHCSYTTKDIEIAGATKIVQEESKSGSQN